MDIIKTIKIAVIAIAIIVILAQIIRKFKNRKDPFLNLKVADDHQDILIPASQRNEVQRIIEMYANKPYERYDNLTYKLSELLLDPLPKVIQQPDESEYYQKLNVPQRVFSLAMQFEGQVDNGGVYQFLWNRPLSMYAARDALATLSIEPLATDYIQVLKELERHADNFGKDKTYWNNPEVPEEDKWKRFQEGRRYIPTGSKIEGYFYDDEFKAKWHKAINAYVERNMDKFIAS
jgi:hypothetical protein